MTTPGMLSSERVRNFGLRSNSMAPLPLPSNPSRTHRASTRPANEDAPRLHEESWGVFFRCVLRARQRAGRKESERVEPLSSLPHPVDGRAPTFGPRIPPAEPNGHWTEELQPESRTVDRYRRNGSKGLDRRIEECPIAGIPFGSWEVGVFEANLRREGRIPGQDHCLILKEFGVALSIPRDASYE